MNIKGVGNLSVIDAYKRVNSKNDVNKINKVQGDRIELSEAGKALSDYSINKNEYDKSFKLEELKAKIKNGMYNVDAKLTAESIIKNMREK